MIDLNTPFYPIINKEIAQRDFVMDYLNRTLTMFEYKDLPETIPERDLELILQMHGYGIITEHNGDLVALWGGFAPPQDIYYNPENVLVNNPWANINRTYKIKDNAEAVLIRNDPLNRGLMPIFNRYGTLMTEAQITYLRALINFRAMFVFTGDDDADKKSAEIFLKKIEAGEGGTMVTGGFENGIQAQPLLTQASNYITQSIEAQQYILGMLYQQIGIQATFNMKRERQTENETNLDTDPLRPLIDAMLEERQKALKAVNEKYGTNIDVAFKGIWSKYNEQVNPTTDDAEAIEINTESFEDDTVAESDTTDSDTDNGEFSDISDNAENPEIEEPTVTVEVNVNVNTEEETETETEVEEEHEDETEKHDTEDTD